MNEKNYDFLKNQIKGMGFGETHGEELKMKMESGVHEFVIGHKADYGRDATASLLNFKKAANVDMYFFNNYSLSLKTEDQLAPVKQTFYTADHFTLKEGYNLLSGRAVLNDKSNKEGQSYTAWFQLNFKEVDGNGNFKMQVYHSNYGFDLKQQLEKYALKELNDPTQREFLVKALERGNRQIATVQDKDQDKKIFLEVVPQYKTLNFYDGAGTKLNREQFYVNKPAVVQEQGASTSREQESKKTEQKSKNKLNKDDGEEGAPAVGKPKKKRRGQSIG